MANVLQFPHLIIMWSLHYGVKQSDNSIEDFVHGYSLPWELSRDNQLSYGIYKFKKGIRFVSEPKRCASSRYTICHLGIFQPVGLYFLRALEQSLVYALLNCFIAEWFITPLNNSTDQWKCICSSRSLLESPRRAYENSSIKAWFYTDSNNNRRCNHSNFDLHVQVIFSEAISWGLHNMQFELLYYSPNIMKFFTHVCHLDNRYTSKFKQS